MGFADVARKALKEIRQAEDYEVKERPRPYLDSEGDLVIPFDSDLRYHWWKSGQSITETINEIKGTVDA